MELIDKKINEALEAELKSDYGNKPVESFIGTAVVESSLKRIQKHLENNEWFIISAHLPGMELSVEKKLDQELVGKIRGKGLGYIPLRGKYTRDDGTVEYEFSFFVVNKDKDPAFKTFAKDLCLEYDQNSILYCKEGVAYFIYKTGEEEYCGKNLSTTDEINAYWSKLKKGRDRFTHFVFESLYPSSNFGLQAAYKRGELF